MDHQRLSVGDGEVGHERKRKKREGTSKKEYAQKKSGKEGRDTEKKKEERTERQAGREGGQGNEDKHGWNEGRMEGRTEVTNARKNVCTKEGR